ncbi:hypothetical protein [Acetobacter syzygii]|uniref:Uncharacterized protein n=1 Tax=Acetobacter syzygii TaxID=146476 RepID=A0A270BL02_9PROT|nr:hypothetical protein [Acetobacter syzygii]NSL91450.1 hypothetical protein [Acetobacter syzygii]PAL24816.1 hypothetical protein B9K05_09005 [Acetobacter syzygii]PAL24930.1 hypothetical protein B9K04_08495 [Acetobacter syzygii]GAN70619.1 hypothetical protein Absy_008_132 [Acetobacter syzygii]GEL55493.1 hypothetical protein ASY01nite_05590 [Acetobacter syzygii]
MADTTVAAQLASSMRTATANRAQAAHRAVQPEHVASSALKVSSTAQDGSSTSMQFDSTGQVVPSGSSHNKHSGTASFINLLA